MLAALISLAACRLWQNNNLALHPQIIVQRANVRINTGRSERDTEARRSQWRLRQPNSLLRSGHDEAGVHVVRGG